MKTNSKRKVFGDAVDLLISDVLDKWYSLVKSTEIGIPAEIEARKIQYEYYRNTLLQFKEKI